jgi:uncharacterized protein YjbI with pentapeptide repeats
VRRRAAKGALAPPQLPAPTTMRTLTDVMLEDGVSLAQVILTDCDLSGARAEDVALDRVLCQRVRLGQANLALAQLLDVRFDACDLAGSAWEKAHVRRAELLGCRAIGLTFSDASLDDVRFVRCNGEQARFWSSTFRAARFEQCVLREASFAESDLSGVVFRGCDLTGADLRGAKLVGADFRGSTIDGLKIGIRELEGAIIEPTQIVHLAGLLGVTVRELGDE